MRLLVTGVSCLLLCLGCGSDGGSDSNGEDVVEQLPTGWVRWEKTAGGNGHAYGSERKTTDWTSAEKAAVKRGATLVTITSAEEQAFVASRFLIGADSTTVYWIGCTDEAAEGTWQWVTGEPFSYTNWKGGEPSGWDGAGEDYGTINWNGVRGLFGEWNDTLVDGTTGYDNGANDGPYGAILEADTSPTK
jgi:hypothetical protein